MGILSKDAFTAAKATTLPRETVAVPELGGDVIVQGMSGTDRNTYEAALLVGKGRKSHVDLSDITAKLLVRCLINEDGSRIFRDDETALIGAVRADALSRLSAVAQRLCGLTDEDVEELGKSSTTPAGTSSSSN